MGPEVLPACIDCECDIEEQSTPRRRTVHNSGDEDSHDDDDDDDGQHSLVFVSCFSFEKKTR